MAGFSGPFPKRFCIFRNLTGSTKNPGDFPDTDQGRGAVQDASGMWHQVLDRPSSYGETSCNAMFVLALAGEWRNGWIDTKLSPFPRWRAGITSPKIGPDGTVTGICQGTGIGENEEFYFTRKRPRTTRGLGAVITGRD